MDRSALVATWSVSVAVLLLGLVSITLLGAVAVAVLLMVPVAEALTMPLMAKTTELPAPAAILTVALRLLPEPVAPLLTEALPVVLEVQVTPVKVAGMVSATVAPVTSFGPLLV